MADQPSFAAQLLLWVTIIVLINVLLVTLATSAAGQLVPTATTSAQHAAVSLHNAASVSATACRIALPTVTPSVKHWAAAARLRTKIVMGIVLLLLGMVPACVIAVAKEIRRILTNFATLCWLGFWSLVEHAVRAVTKLGLFFQASFAAAASTSYNIAVSAVRNLTVTAASAKCLVMNTARFSSSMATSAHRVLWLRLCSRTHEDLPALWLHLDCLAHILLTLVTLETCVALLARHTFLPCGNLVALYALSLLADIMSMPDLCGRVAAVPASASAMLSSAGHGIQSATADAAHSLACLSCRVLAGCVPACTSAHTALLLLTTQAETLWPGCLQLAPLLLLSIPLLGFAGHVLYLLLLPAARTVLFLYITAWLTVPIQPGACAPVTVWAHATAAHVCRGLGLPACHTPQATANKATVVSEPASPIAGPWTFAGQEHFKVLLLHTAVHCLMCLTLCSDFNQALQCCSLSYTPVTVCRHTALDEPSHLNCVHGPMSCLNATSHVLKVLTLVFCFDAFVQCVLLVRRTCHIHYFLVLCVDVAWASVELVSNCVWDERLMQGMSLYTESGRTTRSSACRCGTTPCLEGVDPPAHGRHCPTLSPPPCLCPPASLGLMHDRLWCSQLCLQPPSALHP